MFLLHAGMQLSLRILPSLALLPLVHYWVIVIMHFTFISTTAPGSLLSNPLPYKIKIFLLSWCHFSHDLLYVNDIWHKLTVSQCLHTVNATPCYWQLLICFWMIFFKIVNKANPTTEGEAYGLSCIAKWGSYIFMIFNSSNGSSSYTDKFSYTIYGHVALYHTHVKIFKVSKLKLCLM